MKCAGRHVSPSMSIHYSVNSFPIFSMEIMFTSLNRIAKLENVGTIEVGKDANILMFDAGYNLMRTYVCGRMAFRASSCRKKSVISTEIHHNESMMW